MRTILLMGKERVYALYADYFNDEPLIHVWEVGSVLNCGARDEIGYKLLIDAD